MASEMCCASSSAEVQELTLCACVVRLSCRLQAGRKTPQPGPRMNCIAPSCESTAAEISRDVERFCDGLVCRAKPPVGRNEMKGLTAGPDALDPAQLAAMGSRNALSPRRATALMRQTLGHATVSGLVCCPAPAQGMLI